MIMLDSSLSRPDVHQEPGEMSVVFAEVTSKGARALELVKVFNTQLLSRWCYRWSFLFPESKHLLPLQNEVINLLKRYGGVPNIAPKELW